MRNSSIVIVIPEVTFIVEFANFDDQIHDSQFIFVSIVVFVKLDKHCQNFGEVNMWPTVGFNLITFGQHFVTCELGNICSHVAKHLVNILQRVN